MNGYGRNEKILNKSKNEMHKYDNAHWLSSLPKLNFQTLEEIINPKINKHWSVKTKIKNKQTKNNYKILIIWSSISPLWGFSWDFIMGLRSKVTIWAKG